MELKNTYEMTFSLVNCLKCKMIALYLQRNKLFGYVKK